MYRYIITYYFKLSSVFFKNLKIYVICLYGLLAKNISCAECTKYILNSIYTYLTFCF